MELLIAIAIMGILATVGLGSYFSSLKKSRDARRKSALEQVQRALEMYYNDNGRYPAEGDLSWGSQFASADGATVYMQKLPEDPKSSFTFDYATDAEGTYFRLYACLENIEDPQIIIPSESVNCGGCSGSCNYGISSPNREP